MALTSALLQFLLAATVVVFAGNALTRCADAIAELTKLGRLLVGSIFLAGATSLPELTVDISAVKRGLPDLAVGDLLGSSLFNLLILAVADLMNSSRGRMLSRESAAHALSATMSIALTALAGISIFSGRGWAHGRSGESASGASRFWALAQMHSCRKWRRALPDEELARFEDEERHGRDCEEHQAIAHREQRGL